MIKHKKVKYSDVQLKNIALKYKTRSEFQKNDSSKYNLALRRGIINWVCSHMPVYDKKNDKNPNFKWTDEEIVSKIKECNRPQELREKYPKIYGAAHRRGLLSLFKNRLKKTTLSDIIDYANSVGYKVLSEKITDSRSVIKFKCPKNHDYETQWTYFKNNGDRCGRCARRGTSEGQIELLNWVKEFYPNAKNKKIQSNVGLKEIDIFIPELNLGIEYDGVFWHQESRVGTRYHLNKTKLAKKHNIDLIHIFDYEWLNKKDQVKNFLLSKFNKNLKIYAKDCMVKMIDAKEANLFLSKNHILGETKAFLSAGCFYENKLVGVICFGNHHRQNNNSLVLTRMCFDSGITVVGGVSKILKFLIAHTPSKYKKIITWSDSRWSNGNVYSKIGFVLEKELPPDYIYFKNSKSMLKKQNAKKSILITKGATGTTEKEMAQSLGFYRVWDCGKKRWVLEIKNP